MRSAGPEHPPGGAPREQSSSSHTVLGTGHDLARIEALGGELRQVIVPVLEAVSGISPRTTRVSRTIGLDKSLASRLVRAAQSTSDLDLMHLVPSPGGLRIFANLAARHADPASISNLRRITELFEKFLDAVPGGRASIDAQISESSQVALRKREHIAKQGAFKAMSFLLGHFCDVVTTTLFLVPSPNGRRVDGIEIQRRIGLQRMRPSTPLVLLSIWGDRDDAIDENAISFDTIDGRRGAGDPAAYLLSAYCTQPLPRLDVVREEDMTALVLAGDPSLHTPSQLTSAMHVRNGWPLEPESRVQSLRGYVLHTPCRQVVRDVYIAESLYRDATPQASFLLPGPRPHTRLPREEGGRHYTEVDLARTIEHRPAPQNHDISGVVSHSSVVRHVLERTGHGATPFRGWRLSMTYPVSLVEMIWYLTTSSPSR